MCVGLKPCWVQACWNFAAAVWSSAGLCQERWEPKNNPKLWPPISTLASTAFQIPPSKYKVFIILHWFYCNYIRNVRYVSYPLWRHEHRCIFFVVLSFLSFQLSLRFPPFLLHFCLFSSSLLFCMKPSLFQVTYLIMTTTTISLIP